MRKFDINKLPADVLEKVLEISFDENGFLNEDEMLGEVWLDEGWMFYYDGSHYGQFSNRKDLIELIRTSVTKE